MTAQPAALTDTEGGSDDRHQRDPTSPGAIPRRAYVTLVLRGAVALALGATLLAAGSDLSRLTTFVAAYWIVAAILTLHWAGSQDALPHRRLARAAGMAGLVAGVAVVLRELFKALLSEGFFLDFLGATALATGLLRMSGLIHDDQLSHNGPRRRYRFVAGTLETLLGVALIASEGGASSGTRIILGLWGLCMGTFLLLDGFTVRRLAAAGRST